MKLIPLTKGKVAIVDDRDYKRVSQYNWYAHVNQSGNWCAEHKGRDGQFIMHRFILDAPPGMDVDHRDGDGLNNRRKNLRLCTRSQNLQNRRSGKLGRCIPYKGVHLVPRAGGPRYTAYVKTLGKRHCLGCFDNAEDAARAYNAAAKIHFGEFARYNDVVPCFPEVTL